MSFFKWLKNRHKEVTLIYHYGDDQRVRNEIRNLWKQGFRKFALISSDPDLAFPSWEWLLPK